MLKDHLFKTTGFSALKSSPDVRETGLWLETSSDFLRGNCKDDDNVYDDDDNDNEDDDVIKVN